MGDAVCINFRLAGDKWGREYTRNLRLLAGLGHLDINILRGMYLPQPPINRFRFPKSTPLTYILGNASCRGSYGGGSKATTRTQAGPPKGGFGRLSLSFAT